MGIAIRVNPPGHKSMSKKLMGVPPSAFINIYTSIQYLEFVFIIVTRDLAASAI